MAEAGHGKIVQSGSTSIDDPVIPADIIEKLENNDPELTHLYLTRKRLGKHLDSLELLTNAIQTNTHLKVLDLSHNKIRDAGEKYIHQIIENNKSITNIDISFNYFSPCCITKITPFMRTNLSIIKIHIEEYSARGTVDLFKRISCPHIALVRRNIVTASEQNKQLLMCFNSAGDSISFQKRKFTVIPSTLFMATNLKEVDLSNNLLQHIPPELYQLTLLEKLNISENLIQSISSVNLSSLTNLTELNLENNLLSTLPFTLSSLPLLRIKMAQNLIVSPLSYPRLSFEDSRVAIQISNKNTKLLPRSSIPFSRLFFIGNATSDITMLIPMLHGIQFLHDAYKFLSPEQKEILITSNPILSHDNLFIFEWFPPAPASKEPTADASHNFSRIFRRKSPHNLSASIDVDPENPPSLRTRSRAANRSLRRSIGERGSGIMNVLRFSMEKTEEEIDDSFESSRSSMGVISTVKSEYEFRHISCWLFDPVSTCAKSLLTSGTWNRVPIVYAFQATEDSFTMATPVMQLLHNLHSQHTEETSPLILVATYRKPFKHMKRELLKLKEIIKLKFSKVQYSMLTVCSSTGSGVKQLSSKILGFIDSDTSSTIPCFPFMHKICSPKWFSLYEHNILSLVEAIRTLQEEIKNLSDPHRRLVRSLFTWKELCELFTKYLIIKKQHWQVAAVFLRHIGVIHHFRDIPDSDEAASTIIFLLPNSVITCFTLILKKFPLIRQQIHPGSSLTCITQEGISKAWEMIPKVLHQALLSSIIAAKQIFRFSHENFILPCTFSPLPNMIQLDNPPTFQNISKQTGGFLGRKFSFQLMNDSNYCRIICALHSKVLTVPQLKITHVYENCIIIESALRDSPSGIAQVSYDYARSCVTLFSSEISEEKTLFCTIAEELKLLFDSDVNSFARTSVDHAICVCCNCRSNESCLTSQACIPMDWIEKLSHQGNSFLYCGENAVSLPLVAPEVSMTNFSHFLVEYEELTIIKKVGVGSFASVFYGSHGDKELAIKKLTQNKLSRELFLEFRNEVSLMAGLQHPNTVGLVGLCKKPYCILTEFCVFGDLHSYIASRRERNLLLPMEYIVNVLVDIARGMKFLHTATPPILHRDLKSPNILLCRIAGDEEHLENCFEEPDFLIPSHVDSKIYAKVADFGLSMKTRGPQTERVVDNPVWLAPELLAKQPYSFMSDVYAFGIIANELCTLAIPFSECKFDFSFELEDMIIEGIRPQLPTKGFPTLKRIIRSCWAQIPSERLSFEQIVAKLEFLKSNLSGEVRRANSAKQKKPAIRKTSTTLRRFSEDLLEEEELELLLLHTRRQLTDE